MIMKKILLVILLAAVSLYGCQQKEEPKQQFQPPVGQVPPGGPGAPGHGIDTAKLLQEAVKKDPKNINAWVELGNVMMDTRRFPEAIDAYAKALELDPKNVNVRADMGTCYRYVGKPELAVREYKKVLETDPKHLNARRNMAIVLAYDLHDSKQAVKEFEKVLELEPNSPDADRIRAEIQKLKASAK
jgi:cytochrome c-type biogenesis protein CcmH/NrfG